MSSSLSSTTLMSGSTTSTATTPTTFGIANYAQFLPLLKSRDQSVQLRGAKEFYTCLLNELKEVRREDETNIVDVLIPSIRELANENNKNIQDKQACIYIITSIINLDMINVKVRKKYQMNLFRWLRNLLACSDPTVVHMAARAMGKCVQAGVECDVEFKSGLDNLLLEHRRYQGILLLRELALAAPSRLFLSSATFYENVMNAICDTSAHIRYEAIELFRLSLIISISLANEKGFGQRSSSTINQQQPSIEQQQFSQYSYCFDTSLTQLDLLLKDYNNNRQSQQMNRDERIHGYLLILLEILKFSNLEYEKLIDSYLSTYSLFHQQQQQRTTSNQSNINIHKKKKKKEHVHVYHQETQTVLNCDEMHSLNLYKLLPYSYFDPLHQNDPFLFLFRTDRITVNIQSMQCADLIKSKYTELCQVCLSTIKQMNLGSHTSSSTSAASNSTFSTNTRCIQETLMSLLPRLARFDQKTFCSMPYLKETLLFLNELNQNTLFLNTTPNSSNNLDNSNNNKTSNQTNSLMAATSSPSFCLGTLKAEVIFCVGFIALALRQSESDTFPLYAKQFIDCIRRSPLMSGKEVQRRRLVLTHQEQQQVNGGFNHDDGFPSTSSSMDSSSLSTTSLQIAQIDELNSIMACVAMFASSMVVASNKRNDAMVDAIKSVLEPLMLCTGGVTLTMRYFLNEIAQHIRELKTSIYDNLLRILSHILTGRPLYKVVQCIALTAGHLINSNIDNSYEYWQKIDESNEKEKGVSGGGSWWWTQQQLQPPPKYTDENALVQALQTLRTFQFPFIYSLAFLRYSVDFYIQHESRVVKIEAVLTTSSLLKRLLLYMDNNNSFSNVEMDESTSNSESFDIEQEEQEYEDTTTTTSSNKPLLLTNQSRSLISLIGCALSKLLVCAITDHEADVRYHVLNALHSSASSTFVSDPFRMFLALPDNLRILFLCVRDERFEIRELAAAMISQLSEVSAAYVLPFIRKLLEQLISEIDLQPMIWQRERSVRLMGYLLSQTPRLVNLYASTLLNCLHLKLEEYRHNVPFVAGIITVVGQLASQSGPDTLKHYDTIMPFLIESMQDFYYIQLKHTALWSLTQICSQTGYCIQPYKKYPQLLDILLGFLQTETVSTIRRETIRLLGLLGAIDSFEYRNNLIKVKQNEALRIEGASALSKVKPPPQNQNQSQIIDPSELLITLNVNGTLDEYYPALAIHLMMKTIRHSVNMEVRRNALQALIFAMRRLDTRCVLYVDLVLPPFLDMIRVYQSGTIGGGDNLVITLITQLAPLVSYFKRHVEPYLNSILHIVELYWIQQLQLHQDEETGPGGEKLKKSEINEVAATTSSASTSSTSPVLSDQMIVALIDLVQSIVNVMQVDFRRFLNQCLPLILKQLQLEIGQVEMVTVNGGQSQQTNSTTLLIPHQHQQQQRIQKLLRLIRSCTCCLENYVHLILQQFANYFILNSDQIQFQNQSQLSLQHLLKQEILFTVYTLASQLTLIEHCSLLFHAFLKVLERNPLPEAFSRDLEDQTKKNKGFLSPSNQNQRPSLIYFIFSSCSGSMLSSSSNSSNLDHNKLNSQTHLSILTMESLFLLSKQMQKHSQQFYTFASMFDRVLIKANPSLGTLYEQQLYIYKEHFLLHATTHSSFHRMGLSNIHLTQQTQPIQMTIPPSSAGPTPGPAPGPSSVSNSLQSPATSTAVASPIKNEQQSQINFGNLKIYTDKAELITTKDGWRESFRKFMTTVVEETPVSTLVACSLISYETVPPDLFNACFISIWHKLNEHEQNKLSFYLKAALEKSGVSDIIKCILNLAEFVQRCDCGDQLPLDYELLAEKAFEVKAYAKALHYVEMRFHLMLQQGVGAQTQQLLENLVTLNHELQKDEAAMGVLDYAGKYLKTLDVQKERWYEELHQWDKALQCYDTELQNLEQKRTSQLDLGSENRLNNERIKLQFGRMRCLKGLGDWERLNLSCDDIFKVLKNPTQGGSEINQIPSSSSFSMFPNVVVINAQHIKINKNLTTLLDSPNQILNNSNEEIEKMIKMKHTVAEMGAAASWGLANWSKMKEFTEQMIQTKNENNLSQNKGQGHYETSLYKTVLALTNVNINNSNVIQLIEETRDLLDVDLTAMASQSYERSYTAIVDAQMLTEFEEILSFKQHNDKQEWLRQVWWQRLQGCERSLEYWHRLLLVRSIVLPKEKDIVPWLKFSSLCKRKGQLQLAWRILDQLLKSEEELLRQNMQLLSQTFNISGSGSNQQMNQQQQLNSSICIQLIQTTGDYELCKYSHVKCLHSQGQRREAFEAMKEFVNSNLRIQIQQLDQVLQQQQQSSQQPNITISQQQPQQLQMQVFQMLSTRDLQKRRSQLDLQLSKCYLKLGQWFMDSSSSSSNSTMTKDQSMINSSIQYFKAAREHNKHSYKAWQAWAYSNYDAIQLYKHQQTTTINHSPSINQSPLLSPYPRNNIYIKPAIEGLFKCIKLSHTSNQEANCLQDILRLLTLWFEHGNTLDVYECLADGIKRSPIEIWLQVIPQLIARIDTNKIYVSRLIHQLLIDFGRVHPQALVYRLILASKCNDNASTITNNNENNGQSVRVVEALRILNSLREVSSVLVEQAKLVSEELNRVAILWLEIWHESLEEASKLYFAEKNVQGMLDTLEVLHNMMDKGANTNKESAFLAAYGRELNEARDYCRKFRVLHQHNLNQNNNNEGGQQIITDTKDIDHAWEKYYAVFKRITKQLLQMTSLELSQVSPKLTVANDLELAVPGTYEPLRPLIRISSFNPNIQVIITKQKPRKIGILGSNGREYVFLLKGHEDLRQDERVMQIFGLVNNLLRHNAETGRKDLAIQRYSVIPLSQNSGLLEWLMNCDTLHALIREYRERKKAALNLEYKVITKLAPDYDQLTVIQKVQIFETAIANSDGDDLAKILWHKSLTAEKWLERRSNYTRSLAVMSMMGYVLGLGDRHPSNLMLDRTNGKIVHVDFGDCFETAMNREKFPEKIPFRLTRMLINAMEVTGIEGTFRRTCESVMRVLRTNRDSVMAVLEAFVYDPLVYWKLVEAGNNPNASTTNATRATLNLNAMFAAHAAAQALAAQTSTITGGIITNVNPNETTTTVNASMAVTAIEETEETNRKAIMVLNRVKDKLTGRDFIGSNICNAQQPIDELRQVDLLIMQATSSENLCQCFIGWCAWW